MKKEPSIVTQLKEEEKKGVFKQNHSDCSCCYDVENHDFFRLAVDNSADSIFLIDRKKMCFIDVNKTACNTIGYTKQELLKMGPQHIKPEFTKEDLALKFDTILKYDDNGVIEAVHQRKDGSTFPVEVFLTCLKDKDVIIASVRDITERKKAENEIKSIFNTAANGIRLIDDNHNIIKVNDTFCEMTGLSRNEIVGRKCYEVFTGNLCYTKECPLEKLKNTDKHKIKMEINKVRPDGKEIPTILTATPFKDSNGEFIGIVEDINDVTEQKKARDALKESKEKYRDLFENSNDLIQSVKPDGSIEYVNRVWRKILGYNIEELSNLSIFDIIHPNNKKHCEKVFSKLLSGEDVERIETSFITKNGEKIDVEGSINCRFKDGKAVSTRGIFRDITKRKEAEEEMKEAQRVLTLVNKELERKVEVKTSELKKAHKQLEETNKNLEEIVHERTKEVKQLLHEKNAFINQLSHDLKNPIGPIVNLLPLVIEDTKNEELLEVLEVINRNAVYMKSLIMDTLELARLEGSDKGFEYNNVNLLDVVDDVIKDNDFYFKEKNFEIENNLRQNFPVFADEIRIKEVFNNIFSNALKYNKKENGKIKINAEKQDDSVKISIQDTGIGMTPEQAKHIFDEFYKADPSRHDMVSSGLGLTICKRIIEKHGGEIWAESPGLEKGTTINFTLPNKQKNE